MSEASTIQPGQMPNTAATLRHDLRQLGLQPGQTVMVHTRMSALGWVAGGAQTLIAALMDVLTPDGTLMMPAHTTHNSDPSHWQHPPVPDSWWPILRAELPAYDPATSPTRNLGVTAELFRTWPGVVRSAHPISSFAAWGRRAHELTDDHVLNQMMAERSPLGRLVALDGQILLLGVSHAHNTTLHLAETRAHFAGRKRYTEGCAMQVDGVRQWVTFEVDGFDDEDFERLGSDYEAEPAQAAQFTRGRVGQAEARLLRARPLVDYAVGWLEANR